MGPVLEKSWHKGQLGNLCRAFLWKLFLVFSTHLDALSISCGREALRWTRMAIVGSLAYCVTAISTTITGWLADRAIAAGQTPTRIRKRCTVTGLTLASVVMAVVIIPGSAASMAILMFACLSYGIFTSSHWAITQTIAGPSAAGKWSGLQNSFANMAGVAAPAITGFVVDKTGQFFWAFAVSAVVVLIGASTYAFFLGPVEPIKWKRKGLVEK